MYVICKQKNTKLYQGHPELTFYNSRLDKSMVYYCNQYFEIKGTLSTIDLFDLYILPFNVFKQIRKGLESSAYSGNVCGTGEFSLAVTKLTLSEKGRALSSEPQYSAVKWHQLSGSTERHYLIPSKMQTDSCRSSMFNPSIVKE